jgi:hypothetical protein
MVKSQFVKDVASGMLGSAIVIALWYLARWRGWLP